MRHTYQLRPITVVALLVLSGCSAKTDAAPDTANTAAQTTAMAGMDHSMDHGDDHGMTYPVTIPTGALYTKVDVRFMQGMIAHHAQAIFMSRLAESHGASPRLLKLAMKIDQSQMTEIDQMQGWLRANGQVAPDTSSYHTVMMDGMLTAEQITQLTDAKGVEFDRLFLTFMIMHHEGALKMVKDLNASPGAAQDVDISVFANEVEVVQTAEIDVMKQMLHELPPSP
ncbi:MAG: DUF305 domain-containing protein [Gemmatimonadaceae bacterium]|nr:DUF305 domain-containing protein [Gemmatimonadaceae bacterium]